MAFSGIAQWQGPRWLLAMLLGMLAALLPFSVDMYLPAFSGIAQSLHATPIQMQQTLSAFLLGTGTVILFHGALSDSFGRKRILLYGVALFCFASIGCAISTSIETLFFFRFMQGMSGSVGAIVGRAVVADSFSHSDAQRLIAQIGIFFGIVPAIAPILGGWLFVYWGWRSIFWLLATISAVLFMVTLYKLPETLRRDRCVAFRFTKVAARAYKTLGNRRFMWLSVVVACPFSAMFIYIISAPVFLGKHLALAPTEFFWLYFPLISAGMLGGWVSRCVAGRLSFPAQVNIGLSVLGVASIFNVIYNALFSAGPVLAIAPIALVSFAVGLITPCLSVSLSNMFPRRRGMASSLQSFVEVCFLVITSVLIVPIVMYSPSALAWASGGIAMTGLLAWTIYIRSFPENILLRACSGKDIN